MPGGAGQGEEGEGEGGGEGNIEDLIRGQYNRSRRAKDTFTGKLPSQGRSGKSLSRAQMSGFVNTTWFKILGTRKKSK